MYFQQLNVAIQEEAIAQDKGEEVFNEQERKQHTWDDGEEVVSTYKFRFYYRLLHHKYIDLLISNALASRTN